MKLPFDLKDQIIKDNWIEPKEIETFTYNLAVGV